MNVWVAVAYAVLLFAAAWLLASTAGWRSKLALVAAAPLVAFALWQASRVPAGWPTTHQPPPAATFAWGIVDEPDPASGDPGSIYLWLLPADAARPRAFRLPYSRRLHRQVQAAIGAEKRGRSTSVAAQRGRTGHADGQRSPLRFYPTPPVSLPAKG